MKHTQVIVPWRDGLHLRPAATLVKRAGAYKSDIRLRFGGKLADLRSIITILMLSASFGAVLDLEATGTDENDAVDAIAAMFNAPDDGSGGQDRSSDAS